MSTVVIRRTARGQDGKMDRSVSRQAHAKGEEMISKSYRTDCGALCVMANIG